MRIDKWIGSCKVEIFPWIDGKLIYCNVRYYKPGASVEQAPVWDKTVYITNNDAGRNFAFEFTNTLVDYIVSLLIPEGGHAVITL